VNNICTFGAFVDIGVGTNGLIHSSAMKGCTLKVNERVNVTVLNVDIERKRIGLALNK